MTIFNSHTPVVEPMVGAQHAARILCLPLYYFTKPKSRTAKRIPHYRVGQMIRFRMTELQHWFERFNAEQVEEVIS